MEQNSNTLPLVAIIVPVYNDENYLKVCLDSINNQTVPFWEVRMTDDCSTDSSSHIMKEYCKKDSRFHYVRNETNSKQWISRAKGILSVSPSVKYVMFADADDSLQPNAVERAYELMESSPVDILHFGTNVENFAKIAQKRIQGYTAYLQPPLTELKGREIFESFAERKFEGHLWNKMFNADLLKSVIDKWGVDRVLCKAEDKALYWAVCWHKKDLTYRGVADRLYNYNYGLGLEGGKDTISIEQYRQYLDQARAENLISEIMEEHPDEAKEYARVIDDSRLNLICHTAKGFSRLTRTDAAAGLDLFSEYWTQSLDKAFFSAALAEHTWDNQIELANAISNSKAFTTTKKGANIRVVGTYYHRMKNGGIERIISRLIPYWHRLGYNIVIFTDYPPEEDDYDLPKYVTRVAVGCSYLKSRRGNYVERGINFAQLLNDYHVDCMVYHSHFSDILLYDMCVCKSLNVPFIIYEHSVFTRLIQCYDTRFMTMSVFAGLADGIVCLDDTSAMWWKNFNQNVHTVLNPLTFDLSAVSPARRNNHNILFLCRLNEDAKHPHDAITIIRDLVKILPDAKMYMVGSADSDKYLEGLNKRIVKLKLENNVIMTGFKKDVEKYYEMCSVFLSCSSHEGFMLTATESMSYSIPIVMYDLPYLHTVKNNPGIVTVEQRDTGAAVNELYKLFSDQNRLTEIGDKGRKHLEEMYRVDIGAQWSTVFHSIGSIVSESTPETKMMCDTLIKDYYYGALQHQKLQDDFKEKRDSFNKLQADYNEKCDEFNKLQVELNEKRNALNRLQADYNEKCEALSRFQTNYDNISKALNKLRAEFDENRDEIKRKNMEIRNIEKSLSFRIGRFITFIPRKIRGLIKRSN